MPRQDSHEYVPIPHQPAGVTPSCSCGWRGNAQLGGLAVEQWDARVERVRVEEMQPKPYHVTREGVAGAVHLKVEDVELVRYLSEELSRDMGLVNLMRLPFTGVEALERVSRGLKLLR